MDSLRIGHAGNHILRVDISNGQLDANWLLRVQEMISQVFSNPEPNQDWLKRYQTSIDACARFMQGITVCHEQQNNPQGHISITAQQLMANSGKLRGTDLSQWNTQAYASIPQHIPAYAREMLPIPQPRGSFARHMPKLPS